MAVVLCPFGEVPRQKKILMCGSSDLCSLSTMVAPQVLPTLGSLPFLVLAGGSDACLVEEVLYKVPGALFGDL